MKKKSIKLNLSLLGLASMLREAVAKLESHQMDCAIDSPDTDGILNDIKEISLAVAITKKQVKKAVGPRRVNVVNLVCPDNEIDNEIEEDPSYSPNNTKFSAPMKVAKSSKVHVYATDATDVQVHAMDAEEEEEPQQDWCADCQTYHDDDNCNTFFQESPDDSPNEPMPTGKKMKTIKSSKSFRKFIEANKKNVGESKKPVVAADDERCGDTGYDGTEEEEEEE